MSFYFSGEQKAEMEIIGVSGKARSGKDYFTRNVLVDVYQMVPLALANHFKVEAVALDGMPVDEVLGNEGKSPETRHYLQKRGLEEGRNVHGEDVWLRHLEAWMYALYQKGIRSFAVTDVRFPNEVEWVQSLGGHVIRIDNRGEAETEQADEHASETALDGYEGFDAVIDNSPGREEDAVSDFSRAVFELVYGLELMTVPTPDMA